MKFNQLKIYIDIYHASICKLHNSIILNVIYMPSEFSTFFGILLKYYSRFSFELLYWCNPNSDSAEIRTFQLPFF